MHDCPACLKPCDCDGEELPGPTPPDCVCATTGCGDDEASSDVDWCFSCSDEFRYDDCGGYNPPCQCGVNCRSCCNANCELHDDEDADFSEDFPEPSDS